MRLSHAWTVLHVPCVLTELNLSPKIEQLSPACNIGQSVHHWQWRFGVLQQSEAVSVTQFSFVKEPVSVTLLLKA